MVVDGVFVNGSDDTYSILNDPADRVMICT